VLAYGRDSESNSEKTMPTEPVLLLGKLTVLRELLDYEAGVLTAESKAVRESDVDL